MWFIFYRTFVAVWFIVYWTFVAVWFIFFYFFCCIVIFLVFCSVMQNRRQTTVFTVRANPCSSFLPFSCSGRLVLQDDKEDKKIIGNKKQIPRSNILSFLLFWASGRLVLEDDKDKKIIRRKIQVVMSKILGFLLFWCSGLMIKMRSEIVDKM